MYLRMFRHKETIRKMGEVNGKMVEDLAHTIGGKFGVGEQNDRGYLPLDWMEEYKMIALKICFQHRKNEI